MYAHGSSLKTFGTCKVRPQAQHKDLGCLGFRLSCASHEFARDTSFEDEHHLCNVC